MSKLYLTERGRVVPTLCEELTTHRRARKVLQLPPTEGAATLYVLARRNPGNEQPLWLDINGQAVAIPPNALGDAGPAYRWIEIPVDASWLKAGENAFCLWTDTTAMNGWALAIEAGHAQPRSFVSDDGGKTWRNQDMGYLNVLRGEYVVRLRLEEGQDPPPPAMVWENPAHSRVASLRELLPAKARGPGPLLGRVRALSSWLASSWEHTSSSRATQYAPWDAETILAWGKDRVGHAGQTPIVMCVHYAVAFVSCCQALGIAARCAALTAAVNGGDGHFVAEVWFPDLSKWVMVDPNADAIFSEGGVPLSIAEIQKSPGLDRLVEWGTGTEFQRRYPHMVTFIQENLLKGVCFRHRSLWPRADFLSHPEWSPPGHGALSYCESGLVWEKRDLGRGFGMFPYFGDPRTFDAPPDSGR